MKRTAWLVLCLAVLIAALAGCSASPQSSTVAVAPRATVASSSVAASSIPSAEPTGPIAIPKVIGKSMTPAKSRVEQAGFKAKTRWVSSSAPRGRVVAQKPSRGTALPGTTITLSISKGPKRGQPTETGSTTDNLSSSDAAAARAFRNHSSGIQLSGSGTVSKVLADDNDGDRHQRFILELESGQTLLIAHNIDIAPRLPSLAAGDSVAFKGVYEWNAEGGVVHWTHHDPNGDHAAGWLKYNGTTYR